MDLLWSYRLETAFHWAGVACYAAAAVGYAIEVFFSKEAAGRWGLRLGALGLAPHGAALAARWLASGHGPYMARAEVLSSNAWIAAALFLAVAWRTPRLRGAGIVVMPASLLALGVSVFLDPRARALPPSLRSVWLVFHVLFAKLAAGGLLVALGAAALYLLKERRPASGFASRLPALDILDAYSQRFAGFGFVFWTVMIAAGAIWADQSWGRYWSWDPIETWSLVTWLSLGAYLHLRRFHGWRGARAAAMLSFCFALSLGTLLAVPLLVKTLHGEYFQ